MEGVAWCFVLRLRLGIYAWDCEIIDVVGCSVQRGMSKFIYCRCAEMWCLAGKFCLASAFWNIRLRKWIYWRCRGFSSKRNVEFYILPLRRDGRLWDVALFCVCAGMDETVSEVFTGLPDKSWGMGKKIGTPDKSWKNWEHLGFPDKPWNDREISIWGVLRI